MAHDCRNIAKSVFQVHGVDGAGQVVVRQRLARRRVLAFFQKLAPCLVGIEAWSSSLTGPRTHRTLEIRPERYSALDYGDSPVGLRLFDCVVMLAHLSSEQPF